MFPIRTIFLDVWIILLFILSIVTAITGCGGKKKNDNVSKKSIKPEEKKKTSKSMVALPPSAPGPKSKAPAASREASVGKQDASTQTDDHTLNLELARTVDKKEVRNKADYPVFDEIAECDCGSKSQMERLKKMRIEKANKNIPLKKVKEVRNESDYPTFDDIVDSYFPISERKRDLANERAEKKKEELPVFDDIETCGCNFEDKCEKKSKKSKKSDKESKKQMNEKKKNLEKKKIEHPVDNNEECSGSFKTKNNKEQSGSKEIEVKECENGMIEKTQMEEEKENSRKMDKNSKEADVQLQMIEEDETVD